MCVCVCVCVCVCARIIPTNNDVDVFASSFWTLVASIVSGVENAPNGPTLWKIRETDLPCDEQVERICTVSYTGEADAPCASPAVRHATRARL